MNKCEEAGFQHAWTEYQGDVRGDVRRCPNCDTWQIQRRVWETKTKEELEKELNATFVTIDYPKL